MHTEPPVDVTAPAPTAAAPAIWPDFLAGQPSRPVRVLLVDDDPCARRVIAQELLADLRVHLEGQAASLREGKRLVAAHAFDVLLVGLHLGDGSGLDLVEAAKRHCSGAEIIVISAVEDEEQVLHAFALGATGYLLKNCWFQNYAQAVLNVVNGGASITPTLARRLLGRLHGQAGQGQADGPRPPPGRDSLSTREREILKLVAAGHISGDIGVRLDISVQTVNAHMKNIYRKLRVHTRAHAVSCAARRGLL